MSDVDPVDYAINAIEVLVGAAFKFVCSVVVFLFKLVCLCFTRNDDGTS